MKMHIKLTLALFLASALTAHGGNNNDNNAPANPGASVKTVEFQADETLFANPERGLHVHRQWTNAAGAPLSVPELVQLRETQGISLVLTIYYLDNFLEDRLSNDLLLLIQRNFDALREAGMKAVLRFAYSKSEHAPIFDASEEYVLMHISQLAPLLEKNKDVIALMEAGFVGVWGEWHFSTHYGNANNPDLAKRKKLINALLAALPGERMISIRTPSYKIRMLDIAFTDPLTESEAYNGTAKARLAHHNDCFLADAKDMGTFDGANDRAYTAADSRYTVMGGETCKLSTYSDCINTIKSMETYHWSYLNRDYHPAVINFWKNNGCYEEIQRRLGYRFALKTAKHTSAAVAGETMELRLIMQNKGFAAPYNPRSAEIVFRAADNTIAYRHTMASDPRFWFSGETEVVESINLPASMAGGEYDVLLALADSMETLKHRPEYAMRLANTGVWEETTGMNRLFRLTINAPETPRPPTTLAEAYCIFSRLLYILYTKR